MVTRRVPVVEQELPTLPEHLSSPRPVEFNTGYYGSNCLTKCGKCEGNNYSRFSGDCFRYGCLPGWKGRKCDTRKLVVYRTGCTLSIGMMTMVLTVLLLSYQGSHYFEIRGRSDFSFRC